MRRDRGSLIFKDGHQTVRRDGDCQHQSGREPGLMPCCNGADKGSKFALT
ncbi:Uncharacterized protein dnl_30890 [Desulfonema limicola]|uniref:Uncharacterized protein n=1 Tax=Desulfonema limicola TaxID=45656 RepID=A0A975B8C1_9BACT|nr:Uncharacterized protein dnl_30890 [Desulfonema limicola]